MRPWFIVVVVVVLAGVAISLLIPAISAGPATSEIRTALSNCRQLQLAFSEYSKIHHRTASTLSDLLEAGLIDKPLLDNLTRRKGLYFVYLHPDIGPKDIFMEIYLPEAHVTMTAGGDGKITPIRNLGKKQK